MNEYIKVLLRVAVIFSVCISTSSLANGRFDGVYLGFGGGGVHTWSDMESFFSTRFTAHAPLHLEGSTHNFKLGEYGFNANIFAGYGKTVRSRYYLGGEIFANYFSTEIKGSHNFVNSDDPMRILNMMTEMKNPYSFGADIRIGYLVWPRLMTYILLGGEYAKFSIKSEAEDIGNTEVNRPITNEFDKWQSGFIPGIGVETSLSNHISLRAQYAYTFYSSFSHSHSFLDVRHHGTGWETKVNLETKVKPHKDQLSIKLSYLFNPDPSSLGNTSSTRIEPYFGGTYLGVGGGAVHVWSDVENSFRIYKLIDPFKEKSSAHNFMLGEYGFNANIFAGYGETIRSRYYLGGEIFANYFSPEMKGYHDFDRHDLDFDWLLNMNTKVKNSYSFGSDIRAGYLAWSRMMFYVLFGLDYAKFNVKSTAIDTGERSLIKGLISNRFEERQLGYMPGIGIEAGLSDHVSLRAQYTYTFYPSFSHNISFVNRDKDNDLAKISLKTRIRPYRDKLTIMLSYLFN